MSLRITDLSIELNGEFEQRRVRTHPPGAFTYNTHQTDRTWHFEEIGRIGVEGAAANPDLFSFGGTLGLGLAQDRFSETGPDTFYSWDVTRNRHTVDHGDGTLLEYDLRADFFRASKISGSVFGLQTHDHFARPFLPSLQERRTDYGTTWNFNDDTFPMELRAEHHDTNRDGTRRYTDNERVEENVFDYNVTWNHRANHTAKFDLEYDDTNERYSGSRFKFDTQRTQLRLDDAWQFGSENQHHLDTTVRYQEERGDLQRDLLELGPRLTLAHTPNFSTNYQYQYSREQVGQLDIGMNRGDVGFVHQLFSNLTTTGNLFGLDEQIEQDTHTRELGGSIDWAYTRNNPLGVFSADLNLSHDHSHTTGGGTRAQFRESAAFRDPLPVVLYHPNVIIPTIVVWNSTRTRVFFPGADYIIVRLRHHVVLYRSLLGRIANNESVSIDYVYFEDRSASLSTTRADFRVQQQFSSGWTPYYALETRHEDRETPADVKSLSLFNPISARYAGNDLNRHRIGLKYQQPRYSLGGELEVLQDNIDPFLAYRLFAQHSFLANPSASVDGRLDFSQFFFDRRDRLDFIRYGPERDVLLLEMSLDGRFQWNRNTSGFGRVRYRYQDDNASGVTHGVDASAGAELRWGEYTVSVSIEYDLLNIAESHEDGVGAWLKVRRDFSGMLARK